MLGAKRWALPGDVPGTLPLKPNAGVSGPDWRRAAPELMRFLAGESPGNWVAGSRAAICRFLPAVGGKQMKAAAKQLEFEEAAAIRRPNAGNGLGPFGRIPPLSDLTLPALLIRLQP